MNPQKYEIPAEFLAAADRFVSLENVNELEPVYRAARRGEPQ